MNNEGSVAAVMVPLYSSACKCNLLGAKFQVRAIGQSAKVWLAEHAQQAAGVPRLDEPQQGEATASFCVTVSLISPDLYYKPLGFSGGGERRRDDPGNYMSCLSEDAGSPELLAATTFSKKLIAKLYHKVSKFS